MSSAYALATSAQELLYSHSLLFDHLFSQFLPNVYETNSLKLLWKTLIGRKTFAISPFF